MLALTPLLSLQIYRCRFVFFHVTFVVVGLFDRAKKKFLGDKESELGTEVASSSVVAKASSLYDVDYWQPQDPGNDFKTRSLGIQYLVLAICP